MSAKDYTAYILVNSMVSQIYAVEIILQGNVFSCGCLFIVKWGPMWPLPMMHWTSPYGNPPPPPDIFKLVKRGPNSKATPSAPAPTYNLTIFRDVHRRSAWKDLYYVLTFHTFRPFRFSFANQITLDLPAKF